ncbi:hypothetical protein Bbelb_018080, partial [Branchiostoma belcheri]
ITRLLPSQVQMTWSFITSKLSLPYITYMEYLAPCTLSQALAPLWLLLLCSLVAAHCFFFSSIKKAALQLLPDLFHFYGVCCTAVIMTFYYDEHLKPVPDIDQYLKPFWPLLLADLLGINCVIIRLCCFSTGYNVHRLPQERHRPRGRQRVLASQFVSRPRTPELDISQTTTPRTGSASPAKCGGIGGTTIIGRYLGGTSARPAPLFRPHGTRPVPGQSPVLTRAACGRVPTGPYSSAGQLSGPWRVPGGIPTGSSLVFEQAGACSAARRVPGSEVTASLRRISHNGARSDFNSELKSIRRPRGAKNRPAAVGKPAGLRPESATIRYVQARARGDTGWLPALAVGSHDVLPRAAARTQTYRRIPPTGRRPEFHEIGAGWLGNDPVGMMERRASSKRYKNVYKHNAKTDRFLHQRSLCDPQPTDSGKLKLLS